MCWAQPAAVPRSVTVETAAAAQHMAARMVVALGLLLQLAAGVAAAAAKTAAAANEPVGWLDHKFTKQGASLNEIYMKLVPFFTVAEAGSDYPPGQILLLGGFLWIGFMFFIGAWVVRERVCLSTAALPHRRAAQTCAEQPDLQLTGLCARPVCRSGSARTIPSRFCWAATPPDQSALVSPPSGASRSRRTSKAAVHTKNPPAWHDAAAVCTKRDNDFVHRGLMSPASAATAIGRSRRWGCHPAADRVSLLKHTQGDPNCLFVQLDPLIKTPSRITACGTRHERAHYAHRSTASQPGYTLDKPKASR